MSGSSWSWSYGTFSWIYNYMCNQCLSPLKLRIQLMAMCTRYNIMWLATSRWFSPCTPVSSTNKTDRNDITEILLKVVLNTIIFLLHFIVLCILPQEHGAWISFPPPPFFKNFHINHSFFKMFIIIRFFFIWQYQ